MTSQGQRFRRRALRRGYKVDEVDAFLDRVEATLAGEQIGAPVNAQEVHDVVFRVRFGGYDEWQVDLHLDRVERQLAEMQERGGRGPDPRMDRMGSSMGGGMGADRTGSPMGGGMGADRMGSPMGGGMGADRMGSPMGGGMGADRMAPERPGMNRMAPPTERLSAPIRDDRPMPPPMAPPPMAQPPMAPPPMAQPPMAQPPMGGRAGVPGADQYGRYDAPGYGQQQPPPPPPQPSPYDTGGYDVYEQGRHGKADMTAEMRLPERDNRGGYGSPLGGGPAPMSGSQMPGSQMPAPSMPGSQMPGAPMSGPPLPGGMNNDAQRVDQLRRTFQPRRFGSGYDPAQVDRLFAGILEAVAGRAPMPVNDSELETLQFGLVPGGYFEAEVDAALREVREILRRR